MTAALAARPQTPPATEPGPSRSAPPTQRLMELPALRSESARYFGAAVVDSSGRVQDRAAIAALGWQRGDALHITVVGTSVVLYRHNQGAFTMTGKPYAVLPAAVRARCGITAGSRVLVVADSADDVLIVHPSSAAHQMLRQFHATLAGGEAV